MKVCVVGLGRAGLPLAAVMAESGLEVIGYDIDEERVKSINSGINPLRGEPGLDELIESHSGVNLKAVADIQATSGCYAYIIIVPLFLDEDNNPDFTSMDAAFQDVGEVLEKGNLVVLETTVPVGTTQERIAGILEEKSGLKPGEDFYLAYSPERIMTGYSVSRFTEFPKVVGGVNKDSTNRAYELYQKFSKALRVEDANTAEMVKISEGVYRDVNIALANELWRTCNRAGVNFHSVREAAGHEFCSIHEPGLVGGHCIPIYPWFLMNEFEVPLTSKARRLNENMAGYVIQLAKNISDKGKIAVVGLSYRPGVSEKHFTCSHELINGLKDEGYDVYGFDENFSEQEITEYFNVKPVEVKKLGEMDAVILMHPVEPAIKKLAEHKNKVIDVKNALAKKK